MLDLWRREHFGKGISDHVISGAVDKVNLAIINDPVDEVEVDINVLGAGVVLMVFGEHDCGLIIRKECSGEWEGSERITDQ